MTDGFDIIIEDEILITGIIFVFLTASVFTFAAVVIVAVAVVVNGSETAMTYVFVFAVLFIPIRSVVVSFHRR